MKRLNVLLVSPKSYDDRVDQKLGEYKLFPYSVVYPVNYLKTQDLCDADYIDLVMESREALFDRIRQEHFDLIGFTSTTEARFSTIAMIRQTREVSPASKIVTGGYFFTKTAADAMSHVPELDFIVHGEGEITLAELVKTLASGADDFSGVEGLSYRDGDAVVHNPPRRPATKIDDFNINYDLIQKSGYDLLFPMKNWEDRDDIRAFPMMLGRGCSQHCIFCTFNFLSYRVMSLDTVIKTIDWVLENLDTRYFLFADPSFSERRKFVAQLCNYLIDNDYNIKWYCEARADMPLKLLDLMAKAGCISIDFALESGSDHVLETLKKRLTVEKVEDFAKACHRLGIRGYYFTMISLPDESPEDFMKTFRMTKKLRRYGMRTFIAPLIIFPRGALEALATERGLMPDNFSWYDEDYRCPYRYINPREGNMPHYLELLTEDQVVEFTQMFLDFKLSQYKRRGTALPVAAMKGIKRVASLRSKEDFVRLGQVAKGYLGIHLHNLRWRINRLGEKIGPRK